MCVCVCVRACACACVCVCVCVCTFVCVQFEFGAHDYRGSDASGVQEQMLTNGTIIDTGNAHFIALVVSRRVCQSPRMPAKNQYQ